jgi:DSF synthase
MHAMGVVDVLVKKGEGRAAVEELIRQQQRTPPVLSGDERRTRHRPARSAHDELLEITKAGRFRLRSATARCAPWIA